MKIGALALLAVLAVTGCAAITGCSSFSNSLNHLVDPAPSASPTKSCYQQLRTWEHRYRKTLHYNLYTRAKVANADARAGNLAGYLRTLRIAARTLARLPRLPYCADPHRFLDRIIGKMNAAYDEVRTSSREGLRGALAPLRRLKPLIRKLDQEINRRVHKPTHTPGVVLTAVTRQRR